MTSREGPPPPATPRYVTGLCRPDTTFAIAQGSSSSLASVGLILGHEMGHTFGGMPRGVPRRAPQGAHDRVGMGHDATSGYIMASVAPATPSGENVQFSQASREAAAEYFEETYGEYSWDACMDDAIADDETRGAAS